MRVGRKRNGPPPHETPSEERKEPMTNKRIIPVAALGLLAAAAFAAPAAQADSKPCGLRSSSQAFASWGDTADYWLMKGGDFETPGYWSFAGGATIAAGNEPWKVFG